MAERVQLRRSKGYHKPPGAIVVARPTRWGNPFPVKGDWILWTAISLGYRGDEQGRRAAAVALHKAWLTSEQLTPRPVKDDGASLEFEDGSVVTFEDHCRSLAGGLTLLKVGQLQVPPPPSFDEVRYHLAGRDLACWCPLEDQHGERVPCHADVLLAIAGGNEGAPDDR